MFEGFLPRVVLFPYGLPVRAKNPALPKKPDRPVWLKFHVLALLLLHPLWGQGGGNGLHPGTVFQQACLADPDQTYAVYLPSSYTADRAWPVIYCFDPAAKGRRPVERLQAAAETCGYIVVGSNNSRNGQWRESLAAAGDMIKDTLRRFHVERERLYAAGFSGGARVACEVAGQLRLAGVIASSGGFPGPVPDEVPFVFLGTAGRDDFNYQEMRRVSATLDQRNVPHRLALFDGAHEWLPASLAPLALEWLELQAMRRGLTPRNDAWIQQQLSRRLQAAKALKGEGETYLECTALQADFDGLADTRELVALAKTLKDSRSVRRYLAAEKKTDREEARWDARLAAAIARARAGPRAASALGSARSPAPTAGWPEQPPAGFGRNGGDDMSAGSPPAWPESAGVENGGMAEPYDQFEELRDVVTEMNHLRERDPAVRRSLWAATASVREYAGRKLTERDYAAAVEALGIAMVLQPEDSSLDVQLAWAYALQGRKSSAQDSLQAAVKKGFNDPERLRGLRQALASDRAGILELEPFSVRSKRTVHTSFGLSLLITAEAETRQILKIMIVDVADESEAMARGLGPGAEIISVNDRSVHSLAANFRADSEFGRLFMNRKKSDRIDLAVVKQPGERQTTLTLTQGRDAYSIDHPGISWEEP